MTTIEGQCMKCKEKRVMTNIKHTKIGKKKDRPAVQGTCTKCDTKMFRMGTGAPKKGGASRKSKKSKKSRKSRKSRKSKAGGKSKRSRKSKKDEVMW